MLKRQRRFLRWFLRTILHLTVILTRRVQTNQNPALILTRRVRANRNPALILTRRMRNAARYVIYGNKCGRTAKPKKLATMSGNTLKIKIIDGKKLKKGTYYKFIIVALDENDNVISTSKLIHVATKGGKVGNLKKVTVKKSVLTKAKKMKQGKTLKLGAKGLAQSNNLKVRKHVVVRFESDNQNIATVTSKGKVKAKTKGTCYVYAYTQNGIFKRIKIVVK